MTFLLDTSVLINIERKEKKTIEIITRLIDTDPAPASIGFINYFEFLYGLKLKSPHNKDKSTAFIEKFHCIIPTKNTAKILGDLRHKYEKAGKSFSLADLLIASQAIENNMTLVTQDKHFEEIEELKKVIIS